MMALLQASEILNGTMQGSDVEFSAVSTDTRSLQPGDLYVALAGEHFDGHDYLGQAEKAGAAAAIVHKNVHTNLPRIKVEDTRKALGGLAAAWRQSFNGSVVAITGSNGKTTVKEMTAAILSEQGDVLATKGNFNNDIGLPLTLLRMDKEKFAVIEMGANHSGEIAYLTNVTKPDVAIITNAGPAHLEGFGSIQGVAEAKGEIYQGLTEQGIAVVNLDDEYAAYWLGLNNHHKTITFSMDDTSANVCGAWQPTKNGGVLNVKINGEELAVTLQLHGTHNAMNALAAIALAESLQVPRAKMVQALSKFQSVSGRLNFHRVNELFLVIDDTYNANPESLKAGIEVLVTTLGEHWLILGDMGELGVEGKRIHFDAGSHAKASGINKLLAVGDASRYAAEAFGDDAIFFETKDELIAFVQQHESKKLNILVKGSRFMRMEEIVDSLIKGAN
jgi:UDP-N-acetylmuramoyl-tripeptide--D-alanyl-D-alanine ligase